MAHYSYEFNPAKTTSYLLKPIENEGFSSWSKENMYRTSYINHWTNKPLEPKNVSIPGYGGFIPGMKSSNEYAKTYSQITRDRFSHSELGVNKFKLSSTGFNYKKHDFLDPYRSASSHKYGSQTNIKHHPCLDVEKKVSQNKDTYRDPRLLTAPTFKETDPYLVNERSNTKTSGFLSNYLKCDGNGWVPHKILHGDRTKSEYRMKFNPEKEFHRNTHMFNIRKLKKKTNVLE